MPSNSPPEHQSLGCVAIPERCAVASPGPPRLGWPFMDSWTYLPWIRLEMACWLVVSTHLKNISQSGNLLQTGVKIQKYLKPPSSLVFGDGTFVEANCPTSRE